MKMEYPPFNSPSSDTSNGLQTYSKEEKLQWLEAVSRDGYKPTADRLATERVMTQDAALSTLKKWKKQRTDSNLDDMNMQSGADGDLPSSASSLRQAAENGLYDGALKALTQGLNGSRRKTSSQTSVASKGTAADMDPVAAGSYEQPGGMQGLLDVNGGDAAAISSYHRDAAIQPIASALPPAPLGLTINSEEDTAVVLDVMAVFQGYGNTHIVKAMECLQAMAYSAIQIIDFGLSLLGPSRAAATPQDCFKTLVNAGFTVREAWLPLKGFLARQHADKIAQLSGGTPPPQLATQQLLDLPLAPAPSTAQDTHYPAAWPSAPPAPSQAPAVMLSTHSSVPRNTDPPTRPAQEGGAEHIPRGGRRLLDVPLIPCSGPLTPDQTNILYAKATELQGLVARCSHVHAVYLPQARRFHVMNGDEWIAMDGSGLEKAAGRGRNRNWKKSVLLAIEGGDWTTIYAWMKSTGAE